MNTMLLSILSFGLVLAFGAVVEGKAQESTKAPARFSLGKMTMAITNVEAMVRFYQSVFQTEFKGVEAYGGHMLYSGKLLGMNLLLCPNELAGVDAKQSRIQFDIITDDFDGVLARTAANGGTVREQGASGGVRYATLLDPDENTIVVLEEKGR